MWILGQITNDGGMMSDKKQIVFENVRIQLQPIYGQGHMPISWEIQPSGLNIKDTEENKEIIFAMHETYHKGCKIIIEWE